MENGMGAQKAHRGHCLILPYPLQGHVNPVLQFSKRLQFKGVRITIAATISFFNRIKDATSLFPLGMISDGFDEGGANQAESIEAYLKKFQQVGSETLGELLEKLRDSGSPVDCVVYDAVLPWALDVAKKNGVSGAAFFTQSCADLEPADLPSFVTKPETYPAVVEMIRNQFIDIDTADWVLFNTFYKLEEEVIDWMKGLWPVRPIGPTVPSMYLDKRVQDDTDYGLNVFKPMAEACTKWLEGKASKSVVYVSFGSLASLDAEGMAELAWGLKMTGKYFLWVVRASEESKLPKDFINETSEKGLIVSWCPQLEVLADKSIGCFVTHCGWNSTLEALSLGVPMVGMPQWTDQPTNAKYVTDVWKMGVKAEPDEKGIVTKEEIENCIRQVMEGERGEEITRNAKKWVELTRDAVDEGGTSDKNIDEFVSKLVSP